MYLIQRKKRRMGINQSGKLFEELEKSGGGVVVNAVFKVEEFFNAIFLVVQVSVAGFLLGLGNTLNALVKVMLERVADAFGSVLSQLRENILSFFLIIIIVVVIFFLGLLLGLFGFFSRFFFNSFLNNGCEFLFFK